MGERKTEFLTSAIGKSLIVAAACAVGAGRLIAEDAPMSKPVCISGVLPHLAVVSEHNSECGIGAVVPWAGSLWFMSYPANGPDARLYQVDANLQLHLRAEIKNGMLAVARMIHRESNQLIIGRCFIDAKGTVREVSGLTGRVTAAMRHLKDPANKVYLYGMEGPFWETDVHTLETKVLDKDPVAGAHGKGGYTGQGRVVVANNGYGKDNSAGGCGALAEYDGRAWNVITEAQFCEVTGPGGIYGAPDDDSPVWATGWDKRSVILKVLDKGTWHTYRLPKGSYCYDASHGWFTEWPRIREIQPGRLMMDMHGIFYDFPKDFRPGKTGGLRPIGVHLRMTPDFCHWNGKVVLAADNNGIMNVQKNGQPQSNLWFGGVEDLQTFGKPFGWGGVWCEDKVKAGAASDPYLVAGFEKRCLHLAQASDGEVEFTIQSSRGDDIWLPYKSFKVPAGGYVYHIFPPDFDGAWVRLKADKDCTATAYFHHTSSRGPANGKRDPDMFKGLAGVNDPGPWTAGQVIPARKEEWTKDRENQLWFTARIVDQAGKAGGENVYEVGGDLTFQPSSRGASKAYHEFDKVFGVDEASVIVEGRRLPKTDPAYDGATPAGWPQCIRPIVTERRLLNCHGTFYLLPLDQDVHGLGRVPGIAGAIPISTHRKRIMDFCSWRGLLVLSGTKHGAKADGRYFGAGDGAGLWFGRDDDLWQFEKPTGRGGPWKDTLVKADQPSDPYLMTGYDRKTLELWHDAGKEVKFTIEVDFLRAGNVWRPYSTVTVQPREKARHEFPDGYSAHWVRIRADTGCKATAWFVYE